jgi:hypothetical protein
VEQADDARQSTPPEDRDGSEEIRQAENAITRENPRGEIEILRRENRRLLEESRTAAEQAKNMAEEAQKQSAAPLAEKREIRRYPLDIEIVETAGPEAAGPANPQNGETTVTAPSLANPVHGSKGPMEVLVREMIRKEIGENPKRRKTKLVRDLDKEKKEDSKAERSTYLVSCTFSIQQ